MSYGIVSKQQAVEFSRAVCDCLGHGKNNVAAIAMVEVCAAETLIGEYNDPTPYYAGAGLTQVDYSTFCWLQSKYTNSTDARNIYDRFGVRLANVKFNELDYSPLLAFIFCRLRYKTVTAEIPLSRADRAAYWKRWYNSTAGKGTAEKYIHRCTVSGVDELRFT